MRSLSRALALVVLSVLFVSCSRQDDITTPLSSVQEDGKILAAPAGYDKVPDEYIIVFKDSKVAKNDVEGKAKGLANKHGLRIGHVYETALRGFSAFVPPGILKKLQEEDVIEHIEEDFTITVAPVAEYGKIGGGTTAVARITPERTPWGIASVTQGAIISIGSSTGSAWIIDSGIDPNHPDLNVDKLRSRNFVLGGNQTAASWQDKNGHGTHVAGTIAAKRDGYDVVGVAPGAQVVAVRCLDSRGSGQWSWVVAGVNYYASAATPATDVANMSLGGPSSTALNSAISTAAGNGYRFVVAAGNSSADCSNTSPAGVNVANVYTISAHNANNVFASFSNWGVPVDFCAPGVGIESTKMGGGLTTMDGTSMASPHVAGILLLGPIGSRGNVTGDPDGNPDPLAKVGP